MMLDIQNKLVDDTSYGEFQATEPWIMIETYSPAMQRTYERINMVAGTPSTVMLTGDTGTGKGIIAWLIHKYSNRSKAPFVTLHCGTIPEMLIESELFGHEKGAFTGAIRRKRGKFELAKGGTIFLDEIGTITSATQIKLLEVLQDRIFQPVGGEENISADVRIIVATNIDLEVMCRRGEFRRDLYYRLNVFPIHVPSLIERREDIELFVNFFIKKLNRLYSKKISGAKPEVMSGLSQYNWPGNVRELENLLQRAFILEESSLLSPVSFPREFFEQNLSKKELTDLKHKPTLAEYRRQAVEKAEKEYLSAVLMSHKGRIKDTAKTAGVTRRQIHKLLTRHGIKKEDYRS
jgi:transcriptional regulator with GAF, ATPase, and Fis domain